MAFNISSIVNRQYERTYAERKDLKKDRTEKPGKSDGITGSNKAEKAAVQPFQRVGKVERANENTGISSGNENNLSDKAKKMLDSLREKYGDLDIFVGNTEDELEALSQYGSKEFSVIFTNDELERMADQQEYADNQLKSMEEALEEAKSISEKLFAEGDKTQVNSFSISFGEDGTKKLFASLQRKPETGVEKVAEKKHIRRFDSYVKDRNNAVKRTTVGAASFEELLEKIKSVNWDEISDSKNGDKYNYSV